MSSAEHEQLAQTRARLAAVEASLKHRYTELQEGVEEVRESVNTKVLHNPLLKLGGVVFAGLIVGLILGKRREKTVFRGLSKANKTVVETYVHALRDSVVKSGMSEPEIKNAIMDAIENRLPILIEQPSVTKKSSGVLASVVRGVVTSAVPLLLNATLAYLMGESVGESVAQDSSDSGLGDL